MTGFHDIDQYVQSQLLVAALEICLKTILPGGTFISKVFKGHDTIFLTSQFKVFFNQVDIVKPKSSRPSSVENFIVCRFFNPPPTYALTKLSAFSPFQASYVAQPELVLDNKKIYEFVTCGDLSAFDEIGEEDEQMMEDN